MTTEIREVLDQIIEAATEAKRLAETPDTNTKPFAYGELLSGRSLRYNNALRAEIHEDAKLTYSKTGQFWITLPMPLTAEQLVTVMGLWTEIMGNAAVTAPADR